MSNIGFRILPLRQRVDKDLIRQFEQIPTPFISDNMKRVHAIGYQLRPYHQGGKLLGTAFTVKTRPGDNLMVQKALDLAEPGDVIVVDAGGDTSNAIVGEIMLRIAQKNKLHGFVIDGAIRDVGAIAKDNFPVFAKGVTHRGPYNDGPGEINVPITCAGMVIQPGDLIIGDEDGLAVIPIDEVEQILQLAKQQAKKEAEILQSIQDGTIDRSWIDKVLQEKGCSYEE